MGLKRDYANQHRHELVLCDEDGTDTVVGSWVYSVNMERLFELAANKAEKMPADGRQAVLKVARYNHPDYLYEGDACWTALEEPAGT